MSGAASDPAGKPDLLSLVCVKPVRDTDQGGDPAGRLPAPPEPKEDGEGRYLSLGTRVLPQDLPEPTCQPCRAFPRLEDCVCILTPKQECPSLVVQEPELSLPDGHCWSYLERPGNSIYFMGNYIL